MSRASPIRIWRWPMSRTACSAMRRASLWPISWISRADTSLKPFYAGDRAARIGFNARHCLGKRLGEDFHVKPVGMKQPLLVEHHPDMALPEHQVAALNVAPVHGQTQRIFHHVGVARRTDPRGLQRRLDQAGAI